jgi:hypothetical protein
MDKQKSMTYEAIDSLRWPAMPDPHDRQGMVWIWPRSRVRAFEQKDPQNAHGDGYLQFPFALAVFDRENRHVLSVVVEQTDYRVLARMTGERASDLAGGMKGHLSQAMIATYDAHTHNELEPYEGPLQLNHVMEILVEVVSDTLDLWEEPVRRDPSPQT